MFPCQAVGEAQGDKSGLRAGAGDRFSRAAGNRVDALKHGPLDPATPAQPLGGRGFPLPSVVTPDLLSCSTLCALPAPPPSATPAKCHWARWPCPVVAPRGSRWRWLPQELLHTLGAAALGKRPRPCGAGSLGTGRAQSPRPASAPLNGGFQPFLPFPSRRAPQPSQSPVFVHIFQNKSFWGRISCQRTMAAGPGRRL